MNRYVLFQDKSMWMMLDSFQLSLYASVIRSWIKSKEMVLKPKLYEVILMIVPCYSYLVWNKGLIPYLKRKELEIRNWRYEHHLWGSYWASAIFVTEVLSVIHTLTTLNRNKQQNAVHVYPIIPPCPLRHVTWTEHISLEKDIVHTLIHVCVTGLS